MAELNFDATQVVPQTFEAIPEGLYQAVIVNAEWQNTMSGNGRYLKLEFEILEGDYKGRRLWENLNLDNPSSAAVSIAKSKLSAICHAIDIMQISDSSQLYNNPMTIKVSCRKRVETGDIQNVIKGYMKKAVQGTQNAPTAQNTAPWAR